MTPDELVDEGLRFKEEGNEFFKQGFYPKALASYHKVFTHVAGLAKSDTPKSPTEGLPAADRVQNSFTVPAHRVDEVLALKQSTRLNMAACYLKQEKYSKAVDAATESLNLCESAKGLFRRGQALLLLNSLEECRLDLDAALALQPKDPGIIAEIRKLEAAEKKQVAKEKKLYAGFFEKLQNDDAAELAVPLVPLATVAARGREQSPEDEAPPTPKGKVPKPPAELLRDETANYHQAANPPLGAMLQQMQEQNSTEVEVCDGMTG
jgi:tetratricopeptide (TPR) repeat protein